MPAVKQTDPHQARVRELLAIAAFIATSILALRDFDLFPPLTPHAREILGTPPSQEMLSAALIVYAFSAIILILSRMMQNSPKVGGMSHCAYLGAFYGFYYLSGLLRENFWAVFAAGVTIFALECYQIWNLSDDGEVEL